MSQAHICNLYRFSRISYETALKYLTLIGNKSPHPLLDALYVNPPWMQMH